MRTFTKFVTGVLCLFSVAAKAQTLHPLESGLAITEPQTLRNLERAYGIGFFMDAPDGGTLVSNENLAKTKAFAPIFASIKSEVEAYEKANAGTGVGTKFGKRLFDMDFLTSSRARFALVGVVNRMDRGYVDGSCGEVRMIYRLAYRVESNGEDVFSRLPMTMNLVLKIRPNTLGAPSCSEIAKAWLATPSGLSSKEAGEILTSDSGVLARSMITHAQVDRLELNLQLVRWPAAVRPDFGGHAEYLLKVFAYDFSRRTFRESTLENQIDRDRLMKDSALLKRLRDWLKKPESLRALDQGTIVIPEEFLAKRGFTTAPGGLTRSSNRLFNGVFSKDERAAFDFTSLENIKSAAGLYRRLNDITCTGCHQTRAIGGFHFMGRDPVLKYPGNSVFVPASGHFFGDLPRRMDVVRALAEGHTPDYSKGFASRPQSRRSQSLRSTGLFDGWGAHCSTSNDPSFRDMGCAQGLKCQVHLNTSVEPGTGICVPHGRQEIGDPLEWGDVVTDAFGKDKYVYRGSHSLPHPESIHVGSPQSAHAGKSTGGFPLGAIRRTNCENLPGEAVCGALPAAKGGFNACVGSGKNFVQCIREYSTGVGLRGCDTLNPCRDDYICSESYEEKRGACVPPYFLFQFRVDGHPIGKSR